MPPTPPAASVEDETRLRTLERDLGRLEGVVESLVRSVQMEHELARAARAEDRLAMNELGGRMEKVVSNLAEEVKKLAQESAKQDATLSAKQSQTDGAIGVSRWIIGTAIAAVALAATLFGGKISDGWPRDAIRPEPSACEKKSAATEKPVTKKPAPIL